MKKLSMCLAFGFILACAMLFCGCDSNDDNFSNLAVKSFSVEILNNDNYNNDNYNNDNYNNDNYNNDNHNSYSFQSNQMEYSSLGTQFDGDFFVDSDQLVGIEVGNTILNEFYKDKTPLEELTPYKCNENQFVRFSITLNSVNNINITSITINDVEYKNTDFSIDVENNEIVYDYYPSETTVGYKTFSLDNIKVAHGEMEQTIEIKENNSVKIAFDKDCLSFAFGDVSFGYDYVSVEMQIIDNLNHFSDSRNEYYVALFADNELVDQRKLTELKSKIMFENLDPEKEYYVLGIELVDVYTQIKSLNVGDYFIEKVALNRPFLFKSASYYDRTLKFEYKVMGNHTLKDITKVELYRNTKLVGTYNYEKVQFDELFYNSNYTLKAFYEVEEIEKEISFRFSTPSLDSPEFSFNQELNNSGYNNLTYCVIEKDEDNVGEIISASLTNQRTGKVTNLDVAKIIPGNFLKIEDIDSNTQYRIDIRYTYDLLDGFGDRHIDVTNTISTLRKDKPIVDLENTSIDYTSLSFSAIVPVFEGLKIESIGLYNQNGQLVQSIADLTLTDYKFDNLFTNTYYAARIYYSYDLLDGFGISTEYKFKGSTTKDVGDYSIKVKTITPSYESVSFETEIIQKFPVLTVESVELGGKKYEYASTLTINELLSNKTYSIIINAIIDKHDNTTPTKITYEKSFTTLKYASPGITIDEVTAEKYSFSVSKYTIDDPHEKFIELTKFEYCNMFTGASSEEYEWLQGDIETLVANNTLSNEQYLFRISFSYDLNDGEGVKTGIAKGENTIKTLALTVPTATIIFDEEKITYDSVEASVSIQDPDNVLIDNKTATLYQNDMEIKKITYTDKIVFTDLKADNEYSINLSYFYYPNDHSNELTHINYSDAGFKTKAYLAPTMQFNDDYSATFDTVIIDYSSIDYSSIETYGQITSVNTYTILDNISTYIGEDTKIICGLYSDTEYTVKIVYTYDLHDGQEEGTGYITKNVTTTKKAIPSVKLNYVSSTYHSIKFDVVLEDPYNIAKFVYMEYDITPIYDNCVSLDKDVREINNLYSNKSYYFRLKYSYDLNDRTGIHYIEQKNIGLETKSYTDPPSVNLEVATGENVYHQIKATTSVQNEGNHLVRVDLYIGKDYIYPKEPEATYTVEEYNTNTTIEYTFSDLYSNTTYQVKAVAIYDYNDNQPYHKNESSKQLATQEYTLTRNLRISGGYINATVTMTENDECNRGYYSKFRLYDSVTETYSVVPVSEKINNLIAGRNYTLYYTYTWDFLDGKGEQSQENYVYFYTVVLPKPDFAITIDEPTFDSVNFELKFRNESLKSIFDTYYGFDYIALYREYTKYYDGKPPVKDFYLEYYLEDLTLTSFEQLYANAKYKIVVGYHYDLHKEYTANVVRDIKERQFTTYSINKPEIRNFSYTSTYNSINFDYDLLFTENNDATIQKIELWHGTDTPILMEVGENEFTEILSNTDYVIKFFLNYNLKDANGLITEVVSYDCKTKAHSVPTFTFKDVTSTKFAISYDFDIVNPTGSLKTFTLGLYKSGNLLKNLYSLGQLIKTIDEGLLTDNEYVLKFIGFYDLNEGGGVQEFTVEETVKTKAYELPIVNKQVLVNNGQNSVILFSFEEEYKKIANISYCAAIRDETEQDIVFQKSTTDPRGIIFRCFTLGSLAFYQIKYILEYDYCDGKGTRYSTYYFEYDATPLINTIVVTEDEGFNVDDESITLEFCINGCHLMDNNRYTHIEINGEKYELEYVRNYYSESGNYPYCYYDVILPISLSEENPSASFNATKLYYEYGGIEYSSVVLNTYYGFDYYNNVGIEYIVTMN